MIYACINAYNEEGTIGRAIRSVVDKVDRIVVAEGAYLGFDMRGCPHGYSTDGTVAEAEEAGADIIIETTGCRWQDEIQKRNSYLIGQHGDYYLVLDADEEFFGSALTHSVLDPYRTWDVGFLRPDMPEAHPLFRIFRHEHGLHYRGTHHALWIRNTCLNKSAHGQLPDCWHIKHHVGCRSKDYYDARGAYHQVLREREREFRERHGL